MKKLLIPVLLLGLLACNNKKEKTGSETTTNDNTTSSANKNKPDLPTTSSRPTKAIIDGKEISLGGSLLVTKDENKLQAGAPYLCMLTASNGPNDEALTLNFVFDTKPGVYPVVGMGFTRGPSAEGEVFGKLMGGKPAITEYNVTITDVKDLGDNRMGGHKWRISGTFDDITLPAMRIMLLDKSKNHPESVKIENASFTNLTFDDNWEEMLDEAVEKMKNK